MTSDDVLRRFERSEKASSHFASWQMDSRRLSVVPRLMRHSSKYVNSLGSSEVLEVCASIRRDPAEHALGNISSREAAIPEIADWSPQFAFVHAFHFVIESENCLPTFREAVGHKVFHECIWEDARAHIDELLYRPGNKYKKRQLKRAVRWRVGLAYYALLKELYVTSLLRESGFAVCQHPLADALFRTDFWVEDTNVDLFMENPRYRSASKQGNSLRQSYGRMRALPSPT